jgi:hypothetical protein
MDKKKIAAMIVTAMLVVAGFFLKADFKGMVCGQDSAAQSAEVSQK